MDIAKILTLKYKDLSWTLNGDDYEGLTWLSDTPKPTKKNLEDLWPQVQAEIAAEAQAKIDAKASTIAKLQALGLTLEEVQVAFGLTEENS
jgi:hypothetical protein